MGSSSLGVTFSVPYEIAAVRPAAPDDPRRTRKDTARRPLQHRARPAGDDLRRSLHRRGVSSLRPIN